MCIRDRLDVQQIYNVDGKKALKENTTLTGINLNNTNLDSLCSHALAEAMRVNETIILMDVEANPRMNTEDVLTIQQCLKRNKEAYDRERFEEFLERKKMFYEEQQSAIIDTQLAGQRETKNLVIQRMEEKQKKREDIWTEMVQNLELEKQKMMAKLDREAKLRATKPRRRGRGGKKKKQQIDQNLLQPSST
eukprot:TRINITY_DN3086_c0_g1_i10.p2 TRINITY_DN3086_c0_g1~~TRINITY_DN3086_c0_g1_i10.p2  ORF type:complete len:192 (-),score=52.36 TRINITY_DN3086_c0_g1_i10:218-793(-)